MREMKKDWRAKRDIAQKVLLDLELDLADKEATACKLNSEIENLEVLQEQLRDYFWNCTTCDRTVFGECTRDRQLCDICDTVVCP
jgi:hypothetical protein